MAYLNGEPAHNAWVHKDRKKKGYIEREGETEIQTDIGRQIDRQIDRQKYRQGGGEGMRGGGGGERERKRGLGRKGYKGLMGITPLPHTTRPSIIRMDAKKIKKNEEKESKEGNTGRYVEERQ
jgi:hypothetical protein